ncbi:hypothetical protein QJS04_geneDACA015051 [Acorus gramineus]|uniref:Ribosomal RNA-processing protein 43 n=1 Tax=Acorus gramineus TaxID=55184 RepID=A0AAV9BZ18_ACOGR|nr:hypothetical protein QJS04_geneDACA015051 [Acorus gramineus]
MEVDAHRRLFPFLFYERHLLDSLSPDGRPLSRSRDTSLSLGAVSSADGSALVKFGDTKMLAAIKLEVMTPGIEFYMPPICSPIVRSGRPAEIAPVISKQLGDAILSSGLINLKELSLISAKAAWMTYVLKEKSDEMVTLFLFLQDIYCLNADGSLSDAALFAAVAAFSHCMSCNS